MSSGSVIASILPGAIPIVATALAITWLSGKIAIRSGVVDAPDEERKQQTAPVPRLGGVAIAIGIILPTILGVAADVWRGESVSVFWPSIVFIGAAFLIGLTDDLASPPALAKLALMLGVCGAMATLGLRPSELSSPLGNNTNQALLVIGSMAWLLVFTNAANFMDGTNGLSTGCLAIMLFCLLLSVDSTHLISDTPARVSNLVIFASIGAIVGFLIHNLRGKLYAGDAGSLGLGALFASLGLILDVSVWTVATLALPFLIDVLMTLIWRAKHGQPWLKPHLDHAYQKLRLYGWSHIETAFLYWGLSTVCAVAAIIGAKAGGDAPFFVFWSLCLSGIVLWSIHRRDHPAN